MNSTFEVTHWSACLFFISAIIIGSFAMLDLFLAIVLDGFEATYEEAKTAKSNIRISVMETQSSVVSYLANF